MLFIVVGCQNDKDDNVFNGLQITHMISTDCNDMSQAVTDLLLLLGIRLDLLGVPHLLVSLASIQVFVLMQRQLDDQVVVAEFQVLGKMTERKSQLMYN